LSQNVKDVVVVVVSPVAKSSQDIDALVSAVLLRDVVGEVAVAEAAHHRDGTDAGRKTELGIGSRPRCELSQVEALTAFFVVFDLHSVFDISN
jgi:hypothetical protein